MANIKISEMAEATELNNEDLLPVVQNGVNKKVKIEKLQLKGTVLYESETGTTGNITLSDSVANYDYIEIQCKRIVSGEDVLYGTGRLYKLNGKTISIGATYTDSDNMYVYSKIVTINEKQINVVRANLGFFTNEDVAIASDPHNHITRVVGYK